MFTLSIVFFLIISVSTALHKGLMHVADTSEIELMTKEHKHL